jgi:RNA polymerase sigma-70 factor (ECF subfamily)
MAEDVTHDVFLAAVRTLDDPDSITVGWLIRVARNRMVDVLRRQQRHDEKLRLVGSGRVDEIDLGSRWLDRIRIEAAMEKLSVEHRLVLSLHYLDGYTVPALAKELGRTVKAVEGVVARAKRNLQRELGDRDG